MSKHDHTEFHKGIIPAAQLASGSADSGDVPTSDGAGGVEWTAPTGGGAPTTADYLVGTAHAGLSAEIVVGATPGGELGNTWASPTVDATHSGSSHAGLSGQPSSTDVAVADGGTGSSTAAGARTNLGASASGQTRRVPIRLDTPDATGNGYPALSLNNGFSNVRRVVPAFTKDVIGTWEGAVRIPADYASGGVIVCSYVANATAGVYRSYVSTAVVAVTVTEDTAYTAETAADTTVPGTAKQRFDVSTTLTTTPVANSTLNVRVTHEGNHANDTLAVDGLLWECHFEYVSN